MNDNLSKEEVMKTYNQKRENESEEYFVKLKHNLPKKKERKWEMSIRYKFLKIIRFSLKGVS